jgi:hypothetical protein
MGSGRSTSGPRPKVGLLVALGTRDRHIRAFLLPGCHADRQVIEHMSECLRSSRRVHKSARVSRESCAVASLEPAYRRPFARRFRDRAPAGP